MPGSRHAASAMRARAFALIVQSKCLSSVSSAGRATPVAALWTRTSSGPRAATCSATFARRDVAADERSARRRAPRSRPRSPRRLGRCGGSRSRRAPRPARRSGVAIARPMPREPPVTRTDLPSKGSVIGASEAVRKPAPSWESPIQPMRLRGSGSPSSAFDDAWPSRSSSAIFSSPWRASGGRRADPRSARGRAREAGRRSAASRRRRAGRSPATVASATGGSLVDADRVERCGAA